MLDIIKIGMVSLPFLNWKDSNVRDYKAYYEANKARILKKQLEWARNNADKVRAQRLAWYHRNKERLGEARREWQRNNKDKTLAATKRWQAKNPEKAKAIRDAWYAANPEKKKASRRRCGIRTYGITPEEHATMLAEQKSLCAICEQPPKEGRELAIDHCHRSKVVRGLLCTSCNNGLGRFKDSPELLRAAAAYLERYQCR